MKSGSSSTVDCSGGPKRKKREEGEGRNREQGT